MDERMEAQIEQNCLAEPGALYEESNQHRKNVKKKYTFMSVGIVAVLMLAIIGLVLTQCNKEGVFSPAGGQGTNVSADTLPVTSEVGDTSPETTPSVTAPVQSVWSAWADNLPAFVTPTDYEIETKKLFSTRSLKTTSSTQSNTMDGWELFDTVEANGGFGPWSDWSTTRATATDMREIETQTRYRYRTKATTTGTSSAKNGWTLYNTTYGWSNYGNWSSWSTSKPTASNACQVESKTQYSYRDKWITQEYSSWSEWSGWSDYRQETSDLKKEESRTAWGYYYYLCPNCGAHMHVYTQCYTWAGGCGNKNIHNWNEVWSTTSWDSANLKEWKGTGKYYTYIDGELVFKWNENGHPREQYRYATRTLNSITNYGSWSSYSDTMYSESSTREVKTRMVYRYRTRTEVPTYHFYRWGSWSGWSTNKVSATDNRQVESNTYYRYREQTKTTTYYFRRWTDWSVYSEDEVMPSETMEVRTKMQYRYKSK